MSVENNEPISNGNWGDELLRQDVPPSPFYPKTEERGVQVQPPLYYPSESIASAHIDSLSSFSASPSTPSSLHSYWSDSYQGVLATHIHGHSNAAIQSSCPASGSGPLFLGNHSVVPVMYNNGVPYLLTGDGYQNLDASLPSNIREHIGMDYTSAPNPWSGDTLLLPSTTQPPIEGGLCHGALQHVIPVQNNNSNFWVYPTSNHLGRVHHVANSASALSESGQATVVPYGGGTSTSAKDSSGHIANNSASAYGTSSPSRSRHTAQKFKPSKCKRNSNRTQHRLPRDANGYADPIRVYELLLATLKPLETSVLEQICLPPKDRFVPDANGKFECRIKRCVPTKGAAFWEKPSQPCHSILGNNDNRRKHLLHHFGLSRQQGKDQKQVIWERLWSALV